MDPKHLSVFAMIVELGSISRAAEQLNLTQPTVSRVVRILEDRVGSQLLRRGRYGVTPTQIGEDLAEQGNAILRRTQQAADAVTRWNAGMSRDLRVGVGPMLACSIMGDFFTQLLQQKTTYSVSAFSEYAARLIGALNADEIDLAILPSRLNLHQERLVQIPLFTDPLTVFCSDKDPLARRSEPISVAELADRDWIETAFASGLAFNNHSVLQDLGLGKAKVKLRSTGDVTMLLQVVSQSRALCILPKNSGRFLMKRYNVAPIATVEPFPVRDISFWVGSAKRDRPEVQDFFDRLRLFLDGIGLNNADLLSAT